MTKHDLHDIRDLIRKAALLCHEPHDFVHAEDLTEDEIASLSNDGGTGPWLISWAFCCLAGLLWSVITLREIWLQNDSTDLIYGKCPTAAVIIPDG